MEIHNSHLTEARRAFYGLALLAFFMLAILALPTPPGIKGMANYLPLHMTLETLAVVIAALVFAVGWNAKRHQLSRNTLLLATLFLGVALLDFTHMLSYAGMPDLVTPGDPEKAINFWLAARTLAALALLAAAWLPWNVAPSQSRFVPLTILLLVVAAVHALVLFYPQHLPRTFIANHGLTSFKLAFEYGLIAAYLMAAALFMGQMRTPRTFNASGLFAAAVSMAMSEFFFTLYADVTDIYNLLGHLYKIAAYLFLYRAVFVETVQYPYEQLNASRSQLQATLDALPDLLFEVDAEGRYLDIHASTPGLLAAPVGAALGKTLREVLPEEAAEAAFAVLHETREKGSSHGHRMHLDVPLGKRWFEISAARKENGEGKEPTFLVLSRDVTDLVNQQTQLERETQLNLALLSLPVEAEFRDEKAFMQYGLEQVERLTGSKIAFVHVENEVQGPLDLVIRSDDTPTYSSQTAHEMRYAATQTDVWQEALRQRKPVLINAPASLSGDREDTGGSAALERLISVPVIENGLVRMLVGVGNKAEPYTDKDLEIVRLMASEIWRVANKRRLDDALRVKREELDSFFSANQELFCIANLKGEFVRLNPSWERILGYPLAELEGRKFIDFVHPDDRSKTLQESARINIEGKLFDFENRYRCRDGSYRHIEWRSTLKGNLIYAAARDITERKLRETEMRKLSLAVEQNPFPVVITNLQAQIEYVNQAFSDTTGYGADEVLGKNPSFQKSGKTDPAVYAEMWSRLSKGKPWKGEFINLRKDGQEYVESALIYPVRDDEGAVTHYLAHIEDITPKKIAAERIQQLTNYDQLTGLPNRTQLEARFSRALEQARRQGRPLTVMWIDLDNFKEVNDVLGHGAGDLLLIDISQKLRSLLRDQDTLSRQSGDDFVLVMPDADQNEAALLVTRLMQALSRPTSLDDHELIITASVGIAIYPYDGKTLDALLMCSEAAMYRVKQEGRNNYRFFAPDMQAGTTRMLALSTAMKQALDKNQFSLVYQPQIDLATGSVVGAEALLRWHHPQFGDIGPAEFIPIAENSGLIVQIGEWVLQAALQQLRQWKDMGLPTLVVAVNISAYQFSQPAFPDRLAQLVLESGLPPSVVEIELTEAVAMKNPVMASQTIDALNQKGFRLSIDDFGTGYSSLSYLKRFAVDKLKIDQSFVHDIATNPDDQALVTAIIQMAHSLGMTTIAEGVETAEQLVFLRDRGCNEIQGFFYSRPLTPGQFEAFVQNRPAASEVTTGVTPGS